MFTVIKEKEIVKMFTVIKEHEYLVKLGGRNFSVILHDNWAPAVYDAAEAEATSPDLRNQILDVVEGYENGGKPL